VSARPSIAVLVPCLNEARTVGRVVREFREQLPDARVDVFDNGSTDRTIEVAREAGAEVFVEPRRGKGFVVQTMFRRVDASVYVIVDGDATYPAAAVHELLAPVLGGEADMAVGSRWHALSASEFRRLNRFGNRFFLFVVNSIFDVQLTDMLSGYRAFTRSFVKSAPLISKGFDIETELTIKALEHGHRIVEVPVSLAHRPEGSASKIRIVKDGLLIANTILALFRDYKPLTFFGGAGLAFALVGAGLGVRGVLEYSRTGAVPQTPLAVVSVGCVLLGIVLAVAGLVLHTIARRFRELNFQMRAIEDLTRRGDAPPD
jgi:glycosyltransferase involved in cell wall biosynthesis